MAKAKVQSPVVEQIIDAYSAALESKESVSEEAKDRLIEVLKGAAAPTAKRIGEALFPTDMEEGEL